MWFPLALITALFWGGSDLFSKMGTDPRDKYSHLRIIIMVGTVMGIHGAILLLITHQSFDPMSIIKYLPVSALYIGAMALGYVGLRFLDLSVSSPVCNSSGAVASLLCFIFLPATRADMNAWKILAIALVVIGIVLLSVFDMKDENKARKFRGEVIEDKYRISAIAVFLPIFYCLLDALGTFGDMVVLDSLVSEEEAEIAYEFTFLLCAIVCFIFLVFVKKQKFNIWQEREKGLAALCETAGQFFYVYAIAANPIMAAPLISSYCLFSVILSRIILKEKLSARQYGAIAVAICGIVIMGVFDGA